METWQIFSRILSTPKENKGLFTPTYNGVTATASLVSSTLDWLWRTQYQKTTMVNEWTRRQRRFLQTLNSCRGIGYACGLESIRIFNNLCKPIEIYIYARKNHLFASYPVAKHANSATRGYRHATKTSELIYWRHTGAHFIPRNNFANLSSFAKVSVPVRTT